MAALPVGGAYQRRDDPSHTPHMTRQLVLETSHDLMWPPTEKRLNTSGLHSHQLVDSGIAG